MTAVHALLLPVGADLYALPVDWAREVVAAPTLTPLATAPQVVIGLFNLRGQIVPLLDTAALLGLGRVETTAFAVVVASAQGLTGLATTGFPRRQLLDAPIGPAELPGTTGQHRVGPHVATLLDLAALLSPEWVRDPGSRLDPTPTWDD
ncbi:chemotaxis signal transduction protein [Promicromonospora sp. AC04]|uniref:chemotaxis protein CheW n=1 Tax=Promicromonospora sp. AC04 TaxID=2135723 RepID=UPI000D35C40C|nr:chemotaxis protein CheW [Promicromonospora sp. AC04]PUB25395.1 chemotaxis signal transduction protein [Promicromonospora sp. AC04]